MSQTIQTFSSLAQSLKVKNTFSITINSQYLDMNFELIKQCLSRLQDLEKNINKDRNERQQTNRQIFERLNFIQRDISNHSALIGQQQIKFKEIQSQLGADFRKKLEQLEMKNQGGHDIDQLVKQIQALNKFVSHQNFKQFQVKTEGQLKGINKLKNNLSKFVENDQFNQFKDQTSNSLLQSQGNIEKIQNQAKSLGQKISDVDQKATRVSNTVEENNSLMKQINFSEMLQKLKKFKQQTEGKINDMGLKLKKKIGSNQLGEFQKNIIEKLDTMFFANQKAKADRDQTKQALSYLQKRINEMIEFFNASNNNNVEENDPLFTTKRLMCASCTKDLGKFEGKLGQFRPWSIFPCKQLGPEKTGGYGYVNYIQKKAYKNGYSMDDTNLERLNRTFYDKNSKQLSPKKINQNTKLSNLMENFGLTQKNQMSLKDEYYKNISSSERGSKIFRVKKQVKRDLINDPEKEATKQ